MTEQHEPCTDPACPQHGIAASNARQSEFYANNDRTIVAGPDEDEPDEDEPEFKVPAYVGEDYSTSAIYNTLCELHRDKGTWGSLDGADPIGDNIKRAKFAAEAVRAYAKETGTYQGETVLLAISDLMNDLRHLLDYIGLAEDDDATDGYSPDLEVLAGRDLHYEAEIRGEF